MKALARIYVWWPGINTKTTVKSCQDCNQSGQYTSHSTSAPVVVAKRPWKLAHIDFAEHQGKISLFWRRITVSHSKCPEVIFMRSTTTEVSLLSYGLPEDVVSNNGQLLHRRSLSLTFEETHESSTICHQWSSRESYWCTKEEPETEFSADNPAPAFHPPVQLPVSTTPAELFLKRQLRVHLSMVKPDQEGAVLRKQEKQKDHLRSFMPGQTCCETVPGSTQAATRRCCSASWADWWPIEPCMCTSIVLFQHQKKTKRRWQWPIAV